MSEYGACLTIRRKDGAPLNDAEAKRLEREMKVIARQKLLKGSDGERLLCEHADCADGAATFMMTSSFGYQLTPDDLNDESHEEDRTQARKLASFLEIRHPGDYLYEVSTTEW